MTDDGGSRRLDQIAEVRSRERPTKSAQDRRGEHDVADEPQSHDEHAHGGDYRPQPERRR